MTELPDYDDALRMALKGIDAINDTEMVPPADSAGRVLAAGLVTDRDLPSFNRAQLDGYAIRSGDLGRVESFPVVASIAAGRPADVNVGAGQCVRIATGAPVPDDLDAVIGHEQSDRADPVRFTIRSIDTGHAVHPRGADATAGDTLVAPGTMLGPRHLGIAASVGADPIEVVRRPRVVLLTSGDEVVASGAPVATHQIRNSNGPMITAMVQSIGGGTAQHRHIADDLQETTDAVAAALAGGDLLITVGGISAGERDHFPAALDANGVTLAVHGAAIQPGRPVMVGRRAGGAVTLGLPGNPVSAMACMCLFGWPIIHRLLGLDTALPWRWVELAEPVKPNPRRRAFRPAILVAADSDGERIRVPVWAGSGDLAHTAPTDGLLELPAQPEPVAAGTKLRFLPWP